MMKKRLYLLLLSMMTVFNAVAMSAPALASIPQENPEVIVPEFNGISLYRYCSESIDSVLNFNPDMVALQMGKIPYANVPPSITVAINDFADSVTHLSRTTVSIDEGLNELRELLLYSRLHESVILTKEIISNLLVADIDLKTAERAVAISGVTFNVPNLPVQSRLRMAYDEVVRKLGQVGELLNLYQERLYNLLGSSIDIRSSELDNLLSEVLSVKSYIATDLSLNVNPRSAYVGDEISVTGKLESAGKPLAGREIKILLNNVQSAMVETDGNGYYEANLFVPYLYIPELRVQALYLPVSKDSGVYLSSISPEFRLKVMYYEAKVTIGADSKTYPGRDLVCSVKLDYGSAPVLADRKFEAYLDGEFVREITATEEFSLKISLSPDINLGEHTITFLSSPAGRYAPAEVDTVINVAKAVPVLTMKFPTVVLVPGQTKVEGAIRSEVGVLKNANIDISLAGANAKLNTTAEGAFDVSIKMRMGFELLGSQPLVIQISPQEPWNDTLVISRKVLLVNIVNCGIFMVVVLFFGVFLSRRLKGQIEKYLKRRTQDVVVPLVPEDVTPVYSMPVVLQELSKQEENTEPRGRVISLYISVLRLMQRATSVLMKPNQTLREFASDAQKKLGPLAMPFVEFTKMVERFLYSRHQVTDKEIEESKQLTAELQEGLK